MATPLTRDCVKVFAGQATFLINIAQAQGLKVKAPGYLQMYLEGEYSVYAHIGERT